MAVKSPYHAHLFRLTPITNSITAMTPRLNVCANRTFIHIPPFAYAAYLYGQLLRYSRPWTDTVYLRHSGNLGKRKPRRRGLRGRYSAMVRCYSLYKFIAYSHFFMYSACKSKYLIKLSCIFIGVNGPVLIGLIAINCASFHSLSL